MKKGQISVEYVTIMGFAFLLTIPLVFLFYMNTHSAHQQVDVTQAERVLKKVVETADQMHNLGEPSFTTVRAFIPNDVEEIRIEGRNLIFVIDRGQVQAELVDVAQVNLTGSISANPGTHFIRVEAVDDYVVLSDT